MNVALVISYPDSDCYIVTYSYSHTTSLTSFSLKSRITERFHTKHTALGSILQGLKRGLILLCCVDDDVTQCWTYWHIDTIS